jgi:crossover junction endodeoxyribonuclease RuvC
MGVYVGIDPGVSGAIGFIGNGLVWVNDMPTVTTEVSRKGKSSAKRRVIDPSGLAALLGHLDIKLVVLEKVPPFVAVGGVSKMGSATSFQLGRGFGLCEGVLAALKLPYRLVPPQTWKKLMLDGSSKDKGAALLVARRMFPSTSLTRKSDDGRAEALLMAQYAKIMSG